MGYHTEFSGRFLLNKKLDKELYDYLVKFNETRRMARDPGRLKSLKLKLYYGIEGEYYVDGLGFMGQDPDASILDSNRPPKTQLSLWCQWRPTKDRKGIEWDGGEKFHHYREWMKYILKNFLVPKGYDISGTVHYQGEDPDDHGDLDGAKLTAEVLWEMNTQAKPIAEVSEINTQAIAAPPAPSDGMTVLKPRKIRLD